MTLRVMRIAVLAAMTLAFGGGIAKADATFFIFGTPVAAAQAALRQAAAPALAQAALQARTALRAASGDLRAAGQELRNTGLIYFGAAGPFLQP